MERVWVERVWMERVWMERVWMERVWMERVWVERVWIEGGSLGALRWVGMATPSRARSNSDAAKC